MAVELEQLLTYTDELLEPGRFSDYCPNGLQVQGKSRVERLVTGVTASQALLDAAVESDADAVLVHHGYFWRGEDPTVRGMKRRRLKTLLLNDVSLLAYHLPLDAHPELGNNARLGQLLCLEHLVSLEPHKNDGLGNLGRLPVPQPVSELLSQLEQLTGRAPLHIGNPEDVVETIAWCTGAAQSYIDAAVGAGADVFITGEASEPTVHVAREEGIHFVAAGHHATERYGVQALGEHLAQRFSLEHLFIDIDNPV
ncbi:MAG: Nif3-like dinuclear metal center hexameric protein [Halioglobus sp.]